VSGGQMNHGLTCGECGSPMVLRETSKFKLANGDNRKFYSCTRFPECTGVHGAHPDGTPMGVAADKPTRVARMAAHAAFDAAWQARGLTRKQGYRWLQEITGLPRHEAHISNFGEAQCRALIDRINLAEAVRTASEEVAAEVSA
jgi:ssDNA-binding Zn-finger/Zn-ribbon topoisomerase 1